MYIVKCACGLVVVSYIKTNVSMVTHIPHVSLFVYMYVCYVVSIIFFLSISYRIIHFITICLGTGRSCEDLAHVLNLPCV